MYQLVLSLLTSFSIYIAHVPVQGYAKINGTLHQFVSIYFEFLIQYIVYSSYENMVKYQRRNGVGRMKKIKLLMVEDDTDVMEINREYFEGKGYDTVCAPTLAKARFLLEEHAPDLILLDVMMPDGSGFDYCTELRKKTNAPIIFLTCRDENESVVKGLLRGGDDNVTKPYDLNILNARVAAHLRRAGIMTAGKIELSPLVVDFLSGEATLNGEHIPLTLKELQLLGCFALFAGRRLSCEEIYRRAWGEASGGTSGSIKTHVANLRKKLKLDDGGWFELVSSGKNEYIFSKVRY